MGCFKGRRTTTSVLFEYYIGSRFTHNSNILTTFSYVSSACYEGSKRSETISSDYAIEASALLEATGVKKGYDFRKELLFPMSDEPSCTLAVEKGFKGRQPIAKLFLPASFIILPCQHVFYGCSFPKYCLVEQALLLRFKEENHKGLLKKNTRKQTFHLA